MARAREIGAMSIAFPALGTGVGGFPLEEAARIMTTDPLADPAMRERIARLRAAIDAAPAPSRPVIADRDDDAGRRDDADR